MSWFFFYGVFYLSAFCWKPVFDRNCGETPRYFRQENSGEFVPQNVGLRMIDAPECAKEPGDFSPENRFEMLKNYERIRPIFWENFRNGGLRQRYRSLAKFRQSKREAHSRQCCTFLFFLICPAISGTYSSS